MRRLLFLHRWIGAVFGLLLAILGISGSLLIWKYQWVRWTIDSATQAPLVGAENLAQVVDKAVSSSDSPVNFVLFADQDIGVNLVSNGPKSGFYSDSLGNMVTSWVSRFERPELWMFDLHHDLLMGGFGTWMGGMLGMFGLFFTVSGAIIWWRSRRYFSLAVWPSSFSRRNLAKHHRNLGVLVSPLLFVVMLTGVMMTWKSVGLWMLSAFTPVQEMKAAVAPPKVVGGLHDKIDWSLIMGRAYETFPDAVIRLVTVPKKDGELISMRMKLPEEWLPNGRTLLWFDPKSSQLIDARSELELPTGVRVNNTVYPIHAAKVGGVVYEVLMTFLGLVVALLGLFVVYRFWFDRVTKRKKI